MLGHGSGFDSPGFRAVGRVTPPLGAAFHEARERAGLTLLEVYTLGPRPRAALPARRAPDRVGRARRRLAGPPLRRRRAHHRRLGRRDAGDAGRGAREADPQALLPRALGGSQRADGALAAGFVTWPRVALGCGNFGGIGSAPGVLRAGQNEAEAFAIMDAAWERGIRWFDTADAYGGGRERVGDRRLARRAPAGRAPRHDQGLQPGHRRAVRPRPAARAGPPSGRGQPRAPRRRADRPLPRPRARPGHARRRDDRRLRASSRRRA